MDLMVDVEDTFDNFGPLCDSRAAVDIPGWQAGPNPRTTETHEAGATALKRMGIGSEPQP
ncbi:hypothetical protein [Georgenia subflava]|uniref:Uncharacterized protein n=1 Tax=Georgenia subflava TaxID=1622177 RepID=A0A6N7EI83_9MICO|nr:hypothetical protein [Georgenia subflava]MPV36813.1 hypothetical protein [Georgenia subflava]